MPSIKTPGDFLPGANNSTNINPVPVRSLVHANFTWLDLFRLGQSKRNNSLVHLRRDFAGVDGRIQFEHPPIICLPPLTEQRLAWHVFDRAMADNRDLVVLKRDFQSLFVHSWHISFQYIPIFCLKDVYFGSDVFFTAHCVV